MITISPSQLFLCNLRFLNIQVSRIKESDLVGMDTTGYQEHFNQSSCSLASLDWNSKNPHLGFSFLNHWDYEHWNQPLCASICQISHPWNMRNEQYLSLKIHNKHHNFTKLLTLWKKGHFYFPSFYTVTFHYFILSFSLQWVGKPRLSSRLIIYTAGDLMNTPCVSGILCVMWIKWTFFKFDLF